MSPWTGRRVLITGAAGFVGTNLVAALDAAGADVHGIVRRGTNRWRLDALNARLVVHAGDLTDRIWLAALAHDIQADVVFHAAAARAGHPTTPAERAAALDDTVNSTAALCEAMAAAGSGRIVALGSSLEYGPADVPLDEGRILAPATFRGAAKACATILCRQIAGEAGVPVVVLRPFSVYGPWESPSRFVPTVMRALQTGRDLPLTGPGIRHDFVFVADVVAACLLAAAAPGVNGEVINVGSGRQFANEELVEMAERVAGVRARVTVGAYPDRPVDTGHWVADIDKARRLLGWTPEYSLERGLAETWRWSVARRDFDAPRPPRVDP
jgi:nucleoside-diphosphate-sugar epimerase